MNTFEPSDQQFDLEITRVPSWLRALAVLPTHAVPTAAVVAGIFEAYWIGPEHPWLLALALTINLVLGLAPFVGVKRSHGQGNEGTP